jgi:hypothetical protein
MSQIRITPENVSGYFYLEPLFTQNELPPFKCSIKEYNDYLFSDARRSLNDHIAKTWFLRETATGNLAAYMSLIADSIRLSIPEKELHGLNYPFKTIPAMKIAKLAVDESFIARYRRIGTFMIQTAERFAYALNNDYCAARFLTVDADIEHDEGVLSFYQKNGFILNAELYNKNRKTVSMRKDIYR